MTELIQVDCKTTTNNIAVVFYILPINLCLTAAILCFLNGNFFGGIATGFITCLYVDTFNDYMKSREFKLPVWMLAVLIIGAFTLFGIFW